MCLTQQSAHCLYKKSWVNWMTGLQEYGIYIKPIHIVNGCSLCRLTIEAMHRLEEEEELIVWEQEIEMYDVVRAPPTINENSCYVDVHQYLEQCTIPSHLSITQKRELCLKDLAYQLVHGLLYKKHSNEMLLRCLEAHDSEKVLEDLNDRTVGGQLAGNTTVHKVM